MAELKIGDFTTDIVDEGSGPTIVLVHGSASDRRTWVEVRPILVKAGYRVVSYSRRYHWPNEPAGQEAEYSMKQQVDDLVALIDVVATEPVHLVGHSYGGFLALLATGRESHRVRTQTLIEPPVVPLFLSDPPKPSELIRAVRYKPSLGFSLIKFGATGLVPATKAAENHDMDKALKTMGKAILGEQALANMSPERWDQAQANNIRAELVNGGFAPLTDDDVDSIETPTLLIAGADSPRIWPMLIAHLDGLLPNSQLDTVPGASHLVHEDNLAGFSHSLLAFLAD